MKTLSQIWRLRKAELNVTLDTNDSDLIISAFNLQDWDEDGPINPNTPFRLNQNDDSISDFIYRLNSLIDERPSIPFDPDAYDYSNQAIQLGNRLYSVTKKRNTTEDQAILVNGKLTDLSYLTITAGRLMNSPIAVIYSSVGVFAISWVTDSVTSITAITNLVNHQPITLKEFTDLLVLLDLEEPYRLE